MEEKITKADLVEALAMKTDFHQKDIHIFIDDLWKEIKNALLSGKTIEMRGFGTFELIHRKGRIRARNPKTGEIFSVEDHGVIRFRAGKELKKEAWVRQVKD